MAPGVTAPSLAHRAAALRGTFLCLPQKQAGECLRVNHHTCASQRQARAPRVNTKQRHLLNFHEVYRICGISGVRTLGSPCHRLQPPSATEAQCGVGLTLPLKLHPPPASLLPSLTSEEELHRLGLVPCRARCPHPAGAPEAPGVAGGKGLYKIKYDTWTHDV